MPQLDLDGHQCNGMQIVANQRQWMSSEGGETGRKTDHSDSQREGGKRAYAFLWLIIELSRLSSLKENQEIWGKRIPQLCGKCLMECPRTDNGSQEHSIFGLMNMRTVMNFYLKGGQREAGARYGMTYDWEQWTQNTAGCSGLAKLPCPLLHFQRHLEDMRNHEKSFWFRLILSRNSACIVLLGFSRRGTPWND